MQISTFALCCVCTTGSNSVDAEFCVFRTTLPYMSYLHGTKINFWRSKSWQGKHFKGNFPKKTSQIFEKWIDQKALKIILILVPSCEVSIWWGGTTIKKGCRKASITYALGVLYCGSTFAFWAFEVLYHWGTPVFFQSRRPNFLSTLFEVEIYFDYQHAWLPNFYFEKLPITLR